MLLATSSPHKVIVITGTGHGHFIHALLPPWAVVLVYVVILALLIAGVLLISRAAIRMRKPARIVVAIVAAWTIVGAIVAFLDAYRPAGDWGGAILQGALVVLYGVVGAGIVLAIEKVAKRLRASTA